MLPMEGAKTAAFRLKALLLWLRAHRGSKEAQAFLRRVGCGRALENETKPIALLLWVRALAEFERSAGEAAFRNLSQFIAHPNNLGAWSPLLARAQGPREAFSKLSEVAADGRSEFWRHIRSTEKSWTLQAVPQIHLEPEDQRRVELALKAELESIPLLFAEPKAHVSLPSKAAEPLTFVIEWREAQNFPTATALVITILLALATAGGLTYFKISALEVFQALGAVTLVALLITYFLSRESQQRKELKANRTRILALERASLLSQIKSHEASRPVDEPIVAGAYRVEHQLGTGAYASVWRARRLSDNTDVALKLLRSSVAHDPRATDRLRREAEALGMSWHPHVVEVLDHGLLSSGVAYLVMEELKGESLRDRIDRRGCLSKAEAYELARQSATGLNAAHRAGIIHRDIKPDHVFYHQGQSGELVKLLDFGVAWVSWAEIRLTRDGTTVGTRGYAAPEQLAGDLAAPSADLYSLGITIFQALTGIAPPLSIPPAAQTPGDHSMPPSSTVKRQRPRAQFLDVSSAPRLPSDIASERNSEALLRQSIATPIGELPSWMDLSKVESCWRPLLTALSHCQPDARYQTAAEFLVDLEEQVNPLGEDSPEDAESATALSSVSE